MNTGRITQRVAQLLQARAEVLNIGSPALGRMAGVSQRTTLRTMKGERAPSLDDLALLCAVLGLHLPEVVAWAESTAPLPALDAAAFKASRLADPRQ